jgi:hypothetical protein
MSFEQPPEPVALILRHSAGEPFALADIQAINKLPCDTWHAPENATFLSDANEITDRGEEGTFQQTPTA